MARRRRRRQRQIPAPDTGAVQAPMGRAGDPPRPVVPERLRHHTESQIDRALGAKSFQTLLERHEKAIRELLPHRQDEGLPPGLPEEMQDEWARRQVRTPYLYAQSLMTVAMAMPSQYRARFKPQDEVQPIGTGDPGQSGMGADPLLVAAGQSAEIVQQRFLSELPWADILDEVAQQADLFGTGILKITFRSRMSDDQALSEVTRHDAQDQSAKLRMLLDQARRGEIHRHDAAWHEMHQLAQATQEPGELAIEKSVVAETVALPMLYVDPAVDAPSRFLSARFMVQAVLRTRGQVREAYPYERHEDGTWSGVHPDDLATVSPWGMTRNTWLSARAKRAEEGSHDNDAGDVLMLLEMWDHEHQRVEVLCQDLPYPLASWVPQRQPRDWFPFRFLVLRPVPGEANGIGLVELGADLQRVSHMKASDANLLRWLLLPRWAYDTNVVDENLPKAIARILPGFMGGADFGGRNPNEVLHNLAGRFHPEIGDDAREQADMRRVGQMPEQMQGATGVSNHSSEVKAAMAGMEVSSGYISERCKRFLTSLHAFLLELLYLNVERAEALQITGRYGVWPSVFAQREARELDRYVERAVKTHLLKMQWLAQAFGRPMSELTWRQEYQRLYEQTLMELTGMPALITRQNLLDLLKVDVDIVENTEVQALRKRRDFTEGLQTATAAGLIPDPQRTGQVIQKLYGLDEQFSELFALDPNRLVQQLMVAAAQNPGALSPESLATLQQALGAPAPTTKQKQPPAQKSKQSA